MSNKSQNISFGKKGEQIASEFLLQKGYEILDQNWRLGRKELDIIAKIDDTIVFVEVKTRKNDFYGNPEESVTRSKQLNIMEAAEDYIYKNEIKNEIRFDIISLILDENSEKIYHFEDAILPYDL